MEKKDAFIQTDFGLHNNNNIKHGLFEMNPGMVNMFNQFKSHLEKIDFDEVLKHINLNESLPMMDRNVSCPISFRNGCFGDPRTGVKCMVGGAGLGIMSSIIGYIFILTVVILFLACFLGYLFYLKQHNRCENKDCLFSFDSDFILQMKNDFCNYIRQILTYLLKKSVSIVKHVSKFIHISLDIYNKSVTELLLHIDDCSSDCGSNNCCDM